MWPSSITPHDERHRLATTTAATSSSPRACRRGTAAVVVPGAGGAAPYVLHGPKHGRLSTATKLLGWREERDIRQALLVWQITGPNVMWRSILPTKFVSGTYASLWLNHKHRFTAVMKECENQGPRLLFCRELQV